MEEFQDAIEDAQYITAIDVSSGPQPIIPWDKPTPELLEEWRNKRFRSWEENPQKLRQPQPFGFRWTLSTEIGFFFFSCYLKDVCKEYIQINFIEEVIRWKKLRGPSSISKAREIVDKYLMPSVLDPATKEPIYIPPLEIGECDIKWSDFHGESDDDFNNTSHFIESNSDDACIKCPVGLDGSIRNEILKTISNSRDMLDPSHKSLNSIPQPSEDGQIQYNGCQKELPENLQSSSLEIAEIIHHSESTSLLPYIMQSNLFDAAASIVLEILKRKYWAGYTKPEVSLWNKTLNFLWYRDRPTVQEDFFVMRVLGRGGFGLVTACKKGTSGKLYAMKVMNKKRIKMKKAEQLAVNEQQCLMTVESPFLVNLSYSFQSKDDLFLILDIMTGGDLNFHLTHRGPFNKKTCHYYAARILLGLEALHSKNYVYRDLKPENCLLAEDGRLKISDLGLATVMTSHLRGAAGTRGYWAPEMLRRDENGKKIPYDQKVDWFSFGCVLAEMISGRNPFRTEAAINFGLSQGKDTKEKAMDAATLEYDPDFDSQHFDEKAADLCRRLLHKDRNKRLGSNGSKEIMLHPWFKHVDWDGIIADTIPPPFVPARDVNAASQSEIGNFAHSKDIGDAVLNEEDELIYKDWDWTRPKAFAEEVMEILLYERRTGVELIPLSSTSSCCCAII